MSEKKNDTVMKLCPFRVGTTVHQPVIKGGEGITTQEFYACLKERCMAYSDGKCLRLCKEV